MYRGRTFLCIGGPVLMVTCNLCISDKHESLKKTHRVHLSQYTVSEKKVNIFKIGKWCWIYAQNNSNIAWHLQDIYQIFWDPIVPYHIYCSRNLLLLGTFPEKWDAWGESSNKFTNIFKSYDIMSQLLFSGSRNIRPLHTFPNNNIIYQSWK